MAGYRIDKVHALITGASSGLGVEFARQLAHRSVAMTLVARREAELLQTRDLILGINPAVRVTICVADIATDAGRAAVVSNVGLAESKVTLLINNAGLGDYGRFDKADPGKISQQIDVNVTALTLLTREIIPVMARPGGIVNVSSLAGTLFMPELAVYAATKAYVTSFSEALSVELSPSGISVTAVCPGPTPTNFSKTARRENGEDTNRSGQGVLKQPPERVVRDALASLEAGRAVIYPGAPVALASWIFRVVPRFLLRLIMGRRMKST